MSDTTGLCEVHAFVEFGARAGGFGIGAFEARELIRAMGGRLEVESREGLGTRFRIRLPLADPPGPSRSLRSQKTEVA